MEFKGISTTVVIPPETAARVPVQKPSQSVRPGSFKCTCALGKSGPTCNPNSVYHDLLDKPGEYVLVADVEHLNIGEMPPCIPGTQIVQVNGHDLS